MQYIIRPIARRLQTDETLVSMLIEQLQTAPSPSEKATFPQLVNKAQVLSPELRNWCIDEVDRQLGSATSPEAGFDLVAGDLRPVAHSLLDMLGQSNLRKW